MPKHAAIPMPVRELAARVPRLRSSHVTTWEALAHRFGEGAQEEARRIAATRIAREFADTVRKDGAWRMSQDAEGKVISVEAYCLTYDQLVELMTDAFNAGHKAARTSPVEMVR